MPPKLGESYGNASLYMINHDGSYAKLTDIKDFDIGDSEPPDGPYATGGLVRYEDAPLFVKPDPPMDYVYNWPSETYFTGQLEAPQFTRRQKCMLLGMNTERDIGRTLRLAEKMRRQALKNGEQKKLPWLTLAAIEIYIRNKNKENVKHERA